MSWWDAVPALLAALGFGTLPGLLLAALLGLRGIALVGSAPAFSITSIALASIVAPVLGMPWGPLPVAFTTMAVAVIVTGFRMFWHRMRPHPPIPQDSNRLLLWACVGVVIGALAIGIRFVVIFGSPDNISQTYDNIFHLNAVRFVLESSNASSLTLGGLTASEPGTGTFYPAVWHALVALVAETTGASIPVVINAVSIVIGAVYWPLGCAFLARQVLGPRTIGVAAAGVLAAALGAFPYLLIDFGVLYPYLLGVSLLPAALAYVALSTRVSVRPTIRPSRSRFALLGVMPGLALAHPSVIIALLALSVPVVVHVAVREYHRLRFEDAPRGRYVYLGLATLGTFSLFAAVWILIRVDTAWTAKRTLAQSIGEAVLNAPMGAPVAWIVTLLAVIGIVSLRHARDSWWLVASYAMALLLYVFAMGVPHSLLRAGLVGPWYGDANRLAALLPVVVITLAAIGIVAVRDHTLRFLRGRPRWIPTAPRIAASAAMALALIATQGFSVQAATRDAAKSYVMDSASPLLTPDELEVLNRIDDFVPEGSVVAGNPWTGAALVYSYTGRPALLPHVGGFDTDGTRLLAEQLPKADTNPSVCDVAAELSVSYVLDFGDREVHGGHHDFDGFTDLAESSTVVPLYTRGEAGLYRITAC